MTNIVNYFTSNYDLFGEILHYLGDNRALLRTNRLFFRLVRHVCENEACPKLRGILQAIIVESAIPWTQRQALRTLLFRIQGRIAALSHGVHTVCIDENFADRMKRAIATALSGTVVCRLPFPQKNGAIAYEVQGAASAYGTLVQYLCRLDNRDSSAVVDAFRSLPRHYLKRVFDFLENRPGIHSQTLVAFLSGIHQMLCERGDLKIARLIYDKTYDFVSTSGMVDAHSTLGYMLAQQGDYEDALQLLESALPRDRRNLFLEKLVNIASENGDFHNALVFLEDMDDEEGAIMPLLAVLSRNAIAHGQLDYALSVIERVVDYATRENLYVQCVKRATSSGDYNRAIDIAMGILHEGTKKILCYKVIHAAHNATTKKNVLELLAKLDFATQRVCVANIISRTLTVSDTSQLEIALYYVEESCALWQNKWTPWSHLFATLIMEGVNVDLTFAVWNRMIQGTPPQTDIAERLTLITDLFAKKGDFASAIHFLEIVDPRNALEMAKHLLQYACRCILPNLEEGMHIFLEKYGDVTFVIETFDRLRVASYYARRGEVAKAVEIANDEISTLLGICEIVARRDFKEAMSFIHSQFKDWCGDTGCMVDDIPCTLGDMIAVALVRGFTHQRNGYFAQKVAYRIVHPDIRQRVLRAIVRDETILSFNSEFFYDEREVGELLNTFFARR